MGRFGDLVEVSCAGADADPKANRVHWCWSVQDVSTISLKYCRISIYETTIVELCICFMRYLVLVWMLVVIIMLIPGWIASKTTRCKNVRLCRRVSLDEKCWTQAYLVLLIGRIVSCRLCSMIVGVSWVNNHQCVKIWFMCLLRIKILELLSHLSLEWMWLRGFGIYRYALENLQKILGKSS
jgi:hypothetical protein